MGRCYCGLFLSLAWAPWCGHSPTSHDNVAAPNYSLDFLAEEKFYVVFLWSVQLPLAFDAPASRMADLISTESFDSYGEFISVLRS